MGVIRHGFQSMAKYVRVDVSTYSSSTFYCNLHLISLEFGSEVSRLSCQRQTPYCTCTVDEVIVLTSNSRKLALHVIKCTCAV